ncbi:MAG: recombinase family protein [Oscillospiraceae bacterium]|nr:recombinase family protein [Oscillospiraceae bacterium]
MAYAMYLRKSRADAESEARGEGETLSRHEKVLTELSEKIDLPITDIYREIVSGETIEARPEVQRLLKAVEQKKYDGVFVMDADRIARGDSVDQGIVLRTFRLSGTKIITPRKIYDPTSEFDEEYFEFELFMARREYKIINRRIQRGRIISAKEGRYIGSVPPYGYDKIKIKGDKGHTLKPNGEADTVRYIFSRYLDGKSTGDIAEELDSMDIPTRSGKSWSRATIIDMLKNPVYIGKIRWSYRKNIKSSVNGQIVTIRKTCNDHILVDGLHEPIISDDIFYSVQNRLAGSRKKSVRSSDTLQNPFAGLIYCGICGSVMTRLGVTSHNKYDTIKCSNKKCRCVSAPIFLVEQSVLEFLNKWFDKYTVQIDAHNVVPGNEYINIKKAAEELYSESEKIDMQIANTYDLLEQGVYTSEIFKQRNMILSEHKNEVKTRLMKLEKELTETENNFYAGQKISSCLKYVISAYDHCKDSDEKNLLLKSFLERIEYVKYEPNRRGHLNNANFKLEAFPKVCN